MFNYLYNLFFPENKKTKEPESELKKPNLIKAENDIYRANNIIINSVEFKKLVFQQLIKMGYSEAPEKINEIGFIWDGEKSTYMIIERIKDKTEEAIDD